MQIETISRNWTSQSCDNLMKALINLRIHKQDKGKSTKRIDSTILKVNHLKEDIKELIK